MKQQFFLLIVLSGLLPAHLAYSRSSYRLPDPKDPLIQVWNNKTPHKIYSFGESHFEEIIFKLYDQIHFQQYLLPPTPICFRYECEHAVAGLTLSQLIEEAVQEILSLQPYQLPSLANFTILKMKDVNINTHAGVYILKFKNFPFVVKLFIDFAEGFFKIGDKGFEPLCFYYMGGGINRHLTGFTRIKNLLIVQQLIQESAEWRDKISFPRKWFWLPKNPSWITFVGYNIGTQSPIQATIPAIYAVICDEIIWSEPFLMNNPVHRSTALNLSNFLNQRIDLHINNFGIEQESGKIVIIDYEHFPTFVGLKNPQPFQGYVEWYGRLAQKMIYDMMGRDKQTRRIFQHTAHIDAFGCPIESTS